MAFTYNSAGKVTALSSDASISFPFTAGANSKLVVLTICNATNAAAKVTSGTPTYDGQAMTQCGSTQLSAEGGTEIWYYLSPVASVEKTVVIPNAATSQNLRYCCVDFTNSGANASFFNSGGASDSSGANVACSIASVPADSVCVSCMTHGEKDQFASITTGITLLTTPSIDEGSMQTGAAYSLPVSGPATVTHTYVSGGTSDDFNWVMGAWNEVAPPPLEVNVFDDIGVADTPSVQIPILMVLVFSLIGLTDAVSIEIVSAGALSVNVSDNIGVADDVSEACSLFEYDSHTYASGEDTPYSMVYLNGYVYVGLVVNPGKLLKINASDLSDYTVKTFPDDGNHGGVYDLIYSSTKEKLYALHLESGRIAVSEVNPSDLSASDVIQDTGYDCDNGSIATDESYLYVLCFGEASIVKYDMSTWAVADANTSLSKASGHALGFDGTNLYGATTIAGSSILKIAPSDLSEINQAFTGGPTDDLAFTANHVWVGLEGGTHNVLKISKSDLSDITNIDTGRSTSCYGTFYDGTWIWALYAGTPGYLVRIDPATDEFTTYAFNGTSPNEVSFHSGFLFVSTYTSPISIYKLSLNLIHEINVNDAIGLAEDVAVEIPGAGVLSVNVSDNIGVADDVSASIPILEVSVSDLVGVSDEVVVAISGALEVYVYDDVGLSDEAVSELDLYEIYVSDLISVTDLSDHELPLYNVSIFDDVAVQDIVVNEMPLLEVAVSDGIGVSDDVELALSLYEVSVTDDIGLSDSVVVEISILEVSVSDSIAVTDETEVLIPVLEVAVFDAIGITESVETYYPLLEIAVSEAIGLTDGITAIRQDAATLNVYVYDDIQVAEDVTSRLNLYELTVADNVGVSDETDVQIAVYEVYVSDAIVVTENVTGQVVVPWFLPTSITVTVPLDTIGSGSLIDVYSEDDNELIIDEVTGTPGFDFEFEFGGDYSVPDPNMQLNMVGHYIGNPSHIVKLQQYNYNILDWVNVTASANDFPSSAVEESYSFNLINDIDYISDGKLRVRFNHVSPGNPTHSFVIDHLFIEDAANILDVYVSDTVGLSDVTEASIPVLEILASDSIGVSDDITASIPILEVLVSDAVGVSDETAIEISILEVSVSDTISLTDVIEVLEPVLVVAVADDIGITESVDTFYPLLEIVISDIVGLTDGVTAIRQDIGTLNVYVFDNVQVTETVAGSLNFYDLSVSDDVGVSDEVDVQIAVYEISVYDNVVVADAITIQISTFEVLVTDNIGITDISAISISTLEVSVYDDIGIADEVDIVASVIGVLEVDVADDIVLSDGISAHISILEILVVDNVGVSDETNVLIPVYEILVVDSIEVTDYTEIVNGTQLDISVYDELDLTDSSAVTVVSATYDIDDVLAFSPCYIIGAYLIAEAIVSLPSLESGWPIYTSSLPDVINNACAIYDTTPRLETRIRISYPTTHYGLQIKIRASNYETGKAKIKAILALLETVKNEIIILDDLETYRIVCFSNMSGIISLGQEVGTTKRRYLFTLNFDSILKHLTRTN